jgi:exodeoxyribonuclease-5
MAGLTSAEQRCINCKTDVRKQDENCRKCGDRVKPRPELAKEPRRVPPSHINPSAAQEHVDRIMGHPRTMTASLTGQQADAVEAVRSWYAGQSLRSRSEAPFRLFGPAGTGKTTIAKHIEQALGVQAVFGAYTGKAAHVLRRKGVPATTIHSAIYRPVDNIQLKAEKERLTRKWLDQGGTDEQIRKRLDELEEREGRPFFEFNPGSEWVDADLIVLDEVSMVNMAMGEDIERLGVPVLVLGDPAQLPPVEGGGYYTNTVPDVLLTEVHRQALESPVLRLATDIREGRGYGTVKVNLADAMAADQIICWKNSTRWNLIEKIREKLGRRREWPVPGDRIMCLVNNKDAGVLNGQQFEVLGAAMEGEGWKLRVRDEEGVEREVLAHAAGFCGLAAEKEGKDTLRAYRGKVGLFTFANVITCHKAQGSEWESVYVVDQTHQMWKSTPAEKRAWAYTAVSRASVRVTIASTRT